jgi:CDP-diacylglycerol--serine O-phosphatidyltransferase
MSVFAPFEPEPDEPKRRRFRPIPFRMLLPNLITLLSLCLGLTGIRMAFEGKVELAIAAIVLAAVADGLDGRVARLLKSSSRFGAELDSLADFVVFGVVPGIVLYLWGLHNLKNFGWIVVLFFAVCAALRLARFNVMLDDPNRPDFAGNFFTGMPAPAGALVAMLPIYLELAGIPRLAPTPFLAALYVIGIALLMVSKIPTWSGKKIGARVPREYVLPLFLVAVVMVALLISAPWEVLVIGCFAYLAAVPLAYMNYQKLERAHAAASAGTVHAPPLETGGEDRPNRLN